MPEINMIESEMINRKGLMSYSKLNKILMWIYEEKISLVLIQKVKNSKNILLTV